MFKEDRISAIINLSRQAFGKYKVQILVLIILGFVTAILEGIGVNALIPLFSFVIGDGQGGTDVISRTIEKMFLGLHINFNVTYLLAFITILFIFKALITILLLYIKVRITSDYEFNTRDNLFKKILNSSWPHLLKQKLGHLEIITMVDVPASRGLLDQISQFIMISTSLLIYILIAVNISFPITLTTLIVGAVLFLIFKPFVYRVKSLAYKATSINKDTAHHISENILGVKTVKSMVVESKVNHKGTQLFKALKEINIKTSLIKNTINSFILPISVIFICVLFAFYYKSSTFNFAILIALVYLIQKIFIYIQQLQKNLQNINEGIPHLRSVLNYQKESDAQQEKNQGNNNFIFNKTLEFKDLEFAYREDRPILSKINFIINRGDMIGIIGPSGVGKTTLVDIILRLLNPTHGQVLLDNKNISKINLSKWRKSIGYVSQDIFLVNDTIANNIKFYDESITYNDIIKAAKMANIYDFIQGEPDKFNTIIGERGVMLSVGQRQRIVIARVLARYPKILIFDEATSALDNESEVKIQQVIKNIKGKITVLVIAHRLSTVIDSDKLIVLDNGKIIEQGSPKELLTNKDSYFFKVYNLREN